MDSKIIDGDNIRMPKLARRLCFPIETLQEHWIIHDGTGHHFDANQSSDLRVNCLIDDTHAASTHDLENFVLAQLFRCAVGHRYHLRGETARSSRGIGIGLNADGKGAHTLA